MGLGLGYSLARRESIPLFFTIPALAVQMLLLTVLKYGVDLSKLKGLMVTPFTERLDMGLIGAKTFSHFSAIYLFLLVIFLITVVAFIPAGQLCGRLMERRNNLRSYGINLMGSILGVVLILAISFLWTPPIIWFCICFVCLLVFQLFNPKALFLGILFSLVSVTILAWPTSIGFEKIYSPYQVLERGPGPRGLSLIRAAGHYYQRIHDLSKSNANRNTDPKLAQIANYYELPYKVFGKKPGHVAIVGAGTGNDVAAALRQGATRVEAIEIDPAIWKLGKLFHPEKPYDDPRVTSVINDARTFLRTTDSSFDMIVYGLLDSHTLLSHASSVRLDSYIYTVEALREAILRLKDGGLLSLSFCVLSAEIGRKIYLMMEEAFGSAPICILSLYDHSVIFFQNKEGNFSIENSVSKEIERLNISDYYSDPKIKADVSTDDWPFFYMPKRV
jgi:spermidine synthase